MLGTKLKAIAGLAGILLWGGLTSTAQALLITTTGPSVPGGEAVSGSADFEVVGSTLKITLTNTSAVGDIGQVLDGLGFTLTGGSGFTLTTVIPNVGGGAGTFPFEDCTGATCVGTNTWVDHENNPCQPPFSNSLFCWSLSGSLLLAPSGGSFKPSGIVNSSITHTDGLPNGEHNDYLNGPVEFDISFTGGPLTVSNVVFDWGTAPDTTNGSQCTEGCIILPSPAPEPGSIALVGLALSGFAFARRRWKS